MYDQDDTFPVLHIPTFAGSVALVFFWTLIICTVFGFCGYLITYNGLYVKIGFITGLLVGSFLSFGFLAWVVISHHSRYIQSDYQQNQTTITYAPLGSTPQDSIRIVPLRSYDKMIDKVPARDLAWFCLGLSKNYNHTQRTWVGKTAPSGQLVDALYWKALCNPLIKAGVIRDVGPRKSGTLTTRNLSSMLTIVGLDPNDKDLWMRGNSTEL